MLISITGTPGTGKTSMCEVLRKRGFEAIDLNELARRKGLLSKLDRRRGTQEVDIDRLRFYVERKEGIAFLDSHFSHLMDVDKIIVLRCHPEILRERLERLGWSRAKIRENMEAEAIDLITVESVDRHKEVYEVDTSQRSPEETADIVLSIVQGKGQDYTVGRVDWSEVILSWF